MTPSKVAELLKGKIIANIKWNKYLDWDMCVDEIIFTDGTMIEVGGNADRGRFDTITLPNSGCEFIGDDEGGE